MAVIEEKITIDKKLISPQLITASEIEITSKGSVAVTARPDMVSDNAVYALKATAQQVTLQLDGKISVTDKTLEQHLKSYGILIAPEISANSKVTVENTKASSVSVTRNDAAERMSVAGIVSGSLLTVETDWLNSVSVSASNGFKQRGEEGVTTVCGINLDSNNDFVIQGALAGKISVTGTGKKSKTDAYGIYADEVYLYGGLQKDIAVTGAGTGGSAAAIEAEALIVGLHDDNADWAGKVTVKFTLNTGAEIPWAEAIGLHVLNFYVYGNITKDISVTLTNKTKADGTNWASGIYSENFDLDGVLAGKITVNASCTSGNTDASGIRASNSAFRHGTTKDISVTASGKQVQAIALECGGIAVGSNLENAGWAGKITVKATSRDRAADSGVTAKGIKGQTLTVYGNITKDISVTGSASNGFCNAAAIDCTRDVSIYGDLKGKITVSASTQDGSAEAVCFSTLTKAGSITGKITASASSKSGTATAYGIDCRYIQDSTVAGNLGTISATATGAQEMDSATGAYFGDLLYTGEMVTAKITATAKKGEATGLWASSIKASGETSGAGSFDISATGYRAIGLAFEKAADFALYNSRITAKCTNKSVHAAALADMGYGKVQEISLYHSTLTGDVDLGSGKDSLRLFDKSQVTGDINATEKLVIESGSLIKGNVYYAEEIWLNLDDTASAKKALWEGQEFSSDNLYANLFTDLDFKGKTCTFALLKDTLDADWSMQTVTLCLDGEKSGNMLEVGQSCTYGGYDFALSVSKDRKTLQLSVAESSLA